MKGIKRMKRLVFLVMFAFITAVHQGWSAETPDSSAKLWMPSFFSERMVLQRGKPVPVWGKAAPGEKVSVRFNNQTVSAVTAPDGRWQVSLAPLQADKSGKDLVITAESGASRTIHNVVVGEVWLMSGQSNMAYLMANMSRTPEILGSEKRAEAAKAPKGPSVVKAEADMAAANDPLLRTYRVDTISAERPREDAVSKQGWMEWNRGNAAQFAAMAVYFGGKLRTALDVPVGIIMCAWGGSSACSWISAETLRSSGLNELWPEDVPEWSANLAPSRLYNGMLKPVAPYAVSGFCWYQGETEATELQNAFIYRYLLTGLIRDWRRTWHENSLPFYIVQLPALNNSERWEVVRESQEFALSLPKTALMPTLDIVPPGDLHSKNKYVVAGRLADLVLSDSYGRKTWPGLTRFDRTEAGQGTLRIHFKGAGKGLKTSDGAAPREFQVAGQDRVFKPAEAVIDGQSVVVRSAEVPDPVAVRYAWAAAPKVNLFNDGGLPVLPFRSDDWPVAGQEMMPQNLPEKENLAVTVKGKNLAGENSAPWCASAQVNDPKSGRMYLSASRDQLKIQVKGFPPRAGFPASPELFWTAEPEIDPGKGLTFEAAVYVYDAGAALHGFDLEACVKRADGTFRRYLLTAFPSRIYTFQNFVGGRVPENTQTRLLRSDMDDTAHVFRMAIRPDGVAQLYDNGILIGTTAGETVKDSGGKPYLRIGKTVQGGRWSASIYQAGFDTGGAFAPGANTAAPAEEKTETED